MKHIFWVTALMATLSLGMEEEVENKYLYFSNGHLSNIDISCKKDDDCMLTRSLQKGCSHFIAVNKKLTKKDIQTFNDKESIFWINKDLECVYPSAVQLKKFRAVCVGNVCGLSDGKVRYLQYLPSCGMDNELKNLEKNKRLPECTPQLIEEHIKEEMKRYGIEKKLTSHPLCIHNLRRIK